MSRHRAAVLALVFAATAGVGPQSSAIAQPIVSVRVLVAPPPLPTYVQPVIPADGYLWVPGYWDWDVDFGYFWVPGTWVLPPRPNLLWTPGYWGWNDGVYVFHRGYWDVEVGYYGGIDYGYGYAGTGFQGGYWDGPRFFYNRSVTNITNITITNVYTKTVASPPAASAISYNGGAGGLTVRPTPRQLVIAEQPHVQFTQAQQDQVKQARALPLLRANANHGVPPIAATPRAAAFHSPQVTPAKATGAPIPNALPRGEGAVPQDAKASTDEKLRGARAAVGEAGRPATPQPEVFHAPAAVPGEVTQPAGKKRVEPTADTPEAHPKSLAGTALPVRPAHQPPMTVQRDATEAQRHAQAQVEAAQRLQAETQARQKAEAEQQAAQRQQQAHRAAADVQRRAQEQAAAAAQHQQNALRAQEAEAARRLQVEMQARQAEAERQRAAQQQDAQRAQQAAQQRAAQQHAAEQRRAAEPARGAELPRGSWAEHPACGHPGEPPCR